MRTDIEIMEDLEKVQKEVDNLLRKHKQLHQELTECLARDEDYNKEKEPDDQQYDTEKDVDVEW